MKYPKDAQGYYPKGNGIVLMEVDKKTGLVKSARMEKRTGNKFLDAAALQPPINGASNRVQFQQSNGPLRFGITVARYVTVWLARLFQTECPQSAKATLTTSAKPDGLGAVCQRWIGKTERSGLWTHNATSDS